MAKREKKEVVEVKLPHTTKKLAELAAQIHGVSLKQYMASVVANATISDLVRLDECLNTIESRQNTMNQQAEESKEEEVAEKVVEDVQEVQTKKTKKKAKKTVEAEKAE